MIKVDVNRDEIQLWILYFGPKNEQLFNFYMGIIDEWYTVFQKSKIPHGLILPAGLMSQTANIRTFFPCIYFGKMLKNC